MLTSVIIIIISLVALNFLLLKFSCNKTQVKQVAEAKYVKKNTALVTNQLDAHGLAPTGS